LWRRCFGRRRARVRAPARGRADGAGLLLSPASRRRPGGFCFLRPRALRSRVILAKRTLPGAYDSSGYGIDVTRAPSGAPIDLANPPPAGGAAGVPAVSPAPPPASASPQPSPPPGPVLKGGGRGLLAAGAPRPPGGGSSGRALLQQSGAATADDVLDSYRWEGDGKLGCGLPAGGPFVSLNEGALLPERRGPRRWLPAGSARASESRRA
jgi:hypothetical protein